MNNLSWLIYLSEVIPRVGGVAVVFTIAFVLLTVVYLIALIAWDSDEDNIDEFDKKFTGYYKFAFCVTLLTILLGLIAPSQNTILLIAGSEISEEVVTSAEGKELLNDIKIVIKKQIEDLK